MNKILDLNLRLNSDDDYIIKIENGVTRFQEVERKKQHTFTDFEKQLLLEGYKDFPYIFRNKYGTLYVSEKKPIKKRVYWDHECFHTISITIPRFSHLFQTVQWEDDEPCEWGLWL